MDTRLSWRAVFPPHLALLFAFAIPAHAGNEVGNGGDHLSVDASPLASTEAPATVALYLNPNAPLVHMFFTVKRFRADPEKVRRILGLDPSAFADAVQCCERAGLIRFAGKRIEMLRDNIHLPASSPLFTAYRSALRHKGTEFMHTHGKSRHYSFCSALFG